MADVERKQKSKSTKKPMKKISKTKNNPSKEEILKEESHENFSLQEVLSLGGDKVRNFLYFVFQSRQCVKDQHHCTIDIFYFGIF